MDRLNNLLFVPLPYVAIVVFFVGVVYRDRTKGFTYSSFALRSNVRR